jgi:hypothetical protein
MIRQNLEGVVHATRRGGGAARGTCIKKVMSYTKIKYYSSSVLGFDVFYDVTYCHVASHDVSCTARNPSSCIRVS